MLEKKKRSFVDNQILEMNDEITVSKRVIDYCVNPFDVDKLNELGVNECRQILPFLTRLWKRSQDDSVLNEEFKLAVFQKLRQFEDTNRICSYLNADFAQIYEDVIRQLSIRFQFFSLFANFSFII